MGTPAPFSTQSYTIPLSSLSGAMPELPSPSQIAPNATAASNAGPACPPLWPPCNTAPTLHTHPIALADSMASIPTPQQLAPHVFCPQLPPTLPATPPPVQQQPQAQPPAQPKQPQPPAQPKQPPPPAQSPQQQQPPVPPVQQPPAGAKPKELGDNFDGALTDDIVKTLNRQLNDPDEVTRATAATDLMNILQAHPGLADHQEYKPIVDAFMNKIMKDPSTLVRGMGETTFQLGVMKNPSEDVRAQLKSLAKKGDKNLTKENDQASSILGGLESGTLGDDLKKSAAQKAAKPGDPNGAAAKGAGITPGANSAANPAGQQASAGAQAPKGNPAANHPAGAAQPDQPAQPDQSVPPAQPAPPTDPSAGTADAQPPAGATPDPSTAQGMPGANLAGQPGGFPQVGGYPPQMPAANPIANQAAYQQPSPQAYPQQAPMGYTPAGVGAGGPGFGNRLNVMSSSPSGAGMPSWFGPQTGQRLNVYEGPRS